MLPRSLARLQSPALRRSTASLRAGPSTATGQSSKSTPSQSQRPAGATAAFTSPPQNSQSSNTSGKPDFSKKQDEVDKGATPERNTEPSEAPGPGIPNPSARKGEDPAFSGKQDEFDTDASPSQNTAPQSTSPSAIDPAEAQAPKYPLPDLTQGIPSTLEYETIGSDGRKGLNLTEAAEEGDGAGSGRRGKGELPASAYISSSEKKRLRVANYLYATFAAAVVGGTVYLGRNWETEEEEVRHATDAPSGWAFGLFFNRAKARVMDKRNYFNEPAFPKLLPDVDPIFERPYTLVISMEDLLIHNPYRIAVWQLFREATLYENGEYVKDISYLNRDPSKVIMIDTNPAHVSHQPENAIILKKWEGQVGDKDLVGLIPFLEYIHTMAYTDVRKAIKSFEGTHIPTEFAKREAIARAKFQEEVAAENKKRPKVSGGGFLANALGIKPQGMMVTDPTELTAAEAFAQGKMLQDVARERGQRNFEALDREIRENGEKWLKEEAAMEEKNKEEAMKQMKSGFMGVFGGEKGGSK
ncbi:putative Mitochondrial import inner membrane translocase subunit tim50 [Glarea lozoyensis 74030]|uniref:Mitochondrial import inner membrane translocase subunit TIM50 n=1 Tax=Glarea lozoyensis (strain ATCC 74030 / MF5533) TaxID=1104152 RepID=H0EGR1_GLAL7|nr:putative Mitochondrial import inner membrane translocase subunit tim50 [Glarea lozoyensis 74030]